MINKFNITLRDETFKLEIIAQCILNS